MQPDRAPSIDDTWFDLVPMALVEFDEVGTVLRANPAAQAALGRPVRPGDHLAMQPSAVQRLCGWDAPLTLMSLAGTGAPLQTQTTLARTTGPTVMLFSQVWARGEPDSQRRFLCAIREAPAGSAPPAPQPPPAPLPLGQATPQGADDVHQLLYELSTILESSPAGIAYLRDHTLVRCNRRFERMLGIPQGTVSGRSLDALAEHDPRIGQIVAQATAELTKGDQFEHELEINIPGVLPRSYTLSLRRLGQSATPLEVIAVLSDVTRLRTQQAQLEALGRDRDLMFSLSGVGIAFVRDGLIQSANPALSHLVGDHAAELVGRPLVSLYASEADIDAEPEVMSLLRSLGHWQGERALRRPNGTTLWTEMAVRLVNAERPAEGFIASFVNVDARHRAEQNLTLQADRTRAILDSVFVGIVTLDHNGIAWMNRSARRMFGGDLADFIGQPLSTVATPDLDHPFRLTDYLDQLQDGQSHTFECQVVGRDGRVFWVVGNAVVTYGQHNRRQITYALLDIDRRRQAEAQSAEAQATLQRIIEMAPMAIQLVDAEHLTLVQANQAASAYMALETGCAIGCTPEQVYDPERARMLRADMQAAIDGGEAIHREYLLQSKSGSQVWDVNYLPLHHEDEAADQLLVVASDITEQRAAEKARLDAAIAQREMLVREVHHRIKNNLQGVAGLLQQIAARKPEVAPAISEVVGQVQAIAQVYGLQVGTGGPLRLHSVVEAIAQSVQRTFGRTITLQVQGPHAHDWQLPEAESIPIALSLNELLTNAHKHGPGSTPLMCELVSGEQGVRIDILSPGQLPPDFSLDRVRGGVSGLGLVRALLPRRSARLTLEQCGPEVRTRIELHPPGVHLVAPPPTVCAEGTGQQITLWPQ
ncbi:PAS domain S-box protein [uncultured Aquabacterium sp.]|uniref:PAS domain-containing sensor histidine kinase n=1 Tax=Aquabacterium sp. TaxID=1872578 RepID=UPI0025DEFB5B|nr:PAS domain S-box protein [uncultured Aquabacterium sp.]